MPPRSVIRLSLLLLALLFAGAFVLPHDHHGHADDLSTYECSACRFHQEQVRPTLPLQAPWPERILTADPIFPSLDLALPFYPGHSTSPRGPPRLS